MLKDYDRVPNEYYPLVGNKSGIETSVFFRATAWISGTVVH